ncbi:hypothetical protein Tco_0780687 [Tanacetum coccineum]
MKNTNDLHDYFKSNKRYKSLVQYGDIPAGIVQEIFFRLHQGSRINDLSKTFNSLLVAEVDKRNLNPLMQMRLVEQLRQGRLLGSSLPFSLSIDLKLKYPKSSLAEDSLALALHVLRRSRSIFTSVNVAVQKTKDKTLERASVQLAYLIFGVYLGGASLDCICSHGGFHYGGASLDCVRMAWGSFVGDEDVSGAAWHHVCNHAVFDAALSIPGAACLSQTIFVSAVILTLLLIVMIQIDLYLGGAFLDYVCGHDGFHYCGICYNYILKAGICTTPRGAFIAHISLGGLLLYYASMALDSFVGDNDVMDHSRLLDFECYS